MVFAFERGLPVQQILYIDLAAACVRFGIAGGLVARRDLGADPRRVRRSCAPTSCTPPTAGSSSPSRPARGDDGADRRLARAAPRAEGARAEARADEAERLHEAEQRTVAELRRLSTLRADFVSLVSHEVRTPMAAVIGSARTLQQRWRELTAEQRDAFLALIADETDRLAALVGEVLDSSRIDAGTFSYTFAELDLAGLSTRRSRRPSWPATRSGSPPRCRPTCPASAAIRSGSARC